MPLARTAQVFNAAIHGVPVPKLLYGPGAVVARAYPLTATVHPWCGPSSPMS
ncbi:hypothetical protein [Streptomyces sp. AF1A]|jgi:hypothetical protein|uniref:hypothetical protein n=1 Tax=Streptomyces sp. AF1A TaxID=3394350 RepID=UPI0039BC69A3